MVDMLLFIAASITIVVTLVVIYMVCGQSKLKALVVNIALQHTKAVEAANLPTRYCICKPNWYNLSLLLIMLLGITYLIIHKVRKSLFALRVPIFKYNQDSTFYIQCYYICTHKIKQDSRKYTFV